MTLQTKLFQWKTVLYCTDLKDVLTLQTKLYWCAIIHCTVWYRGCNDSTNKTVPVKNCIVLYRSKGCTNPPNKTVLVCYNTLYCLDKEYVMTIQTKLYRCTKYIVLSRSGGCTDPPNQTVPVCAHLPWQMPATCDVTEKPTAQGGCQ